MCFTENGTVIVRTPYEDTYSGGKTLSHVPQPSSQLHGVSGTDGSFRQGTPEYVVSFGEGARLSQTPDLPPSYEDVMSQNYLLIVTAKMYELKQLMNQMVDSFVCRYVN